MWRARRRGERSRARSRGPGLPSHGTDTNSGEGQRSRPGISVDRGWARSKKARPLMRVHLSKREKSPHGATCDSLPAGSTPRRRTWRMSDVRGRLLPAREEGSTKVRAESTSSREVVLRACCMYVGFLHRVRQSQMIVYLSVPRRRSSQLGCLAARARRSVSVSGPVSASRAAGTGRDTTVYLCLLMARLQPATFSVARWTASPQTTHPPAPARNTSRFKRRDQTAVYPSSPLESRNPGFRRRRRQQVKLSSDGQTEAGGIAWPGRVRVKVFFPDLPWGCEGKRRRVPMITLCTGTWSFFRTRFKVQAPPLPWGCEGKRR